MIDPEKIIVLLHSFRKRKGMYVVPESLESVNSFLSGLTCAVISQDSEMEYPNNLLHDIGKNRGWKRSPSGPMHRLSESKLTEEEKMNELIDIYIEAFNILFKDTGAKDA